MKVYYDTPYRELLTAIGAYGITADELEACFSQVSHLAVKDSLNYDINLLIFGKLCRLQAIKTGGELLTLANTIINGPIEREYKYLPRIRKAWDSYRSQRSTRAFLKLQAADALRFTLKVKQDMEQVVRLFDAIKYQPSPDEIKAGITEISGSLHNVADWYARRMGITDVEQVYLLPWVRIYAALKIDVTDIQFKRRLNKVIENKNRK